jgi:hypothetical protein
MSRMMLTTSTFKYEPVADVIKGITSYVTEKEKLTATFARSKTAKPYLFKSARRIFRKNEQAITNC